MNTVQCAIGAASATVIADSVSPEGVRLTTIQVRYPRIIHAEVRTHRRHSIGSESRVILKDKCILADRGLSRNARSSRAVPVHRLLAEVEESPFLPLFARNQPGMQAGDLLDEAASADACGIWREAAGAAAWAARELLDLGVHKQWANRLLEPFGFIDVVISATDWANFLALRCHPAAQPEMQDLADCIRAVLSASHPTQVAFGDWHLPYVEQDTEVEPIRQYLIATESALDPIDIMRRLSVVRCARVSYAPHTGGESAIGRDMNRYWELVNAKPVHASPAEHQATPDRRHPGGVWGRPELHGNFTGWCQFRKSLPGECVPG